MQQVRTLPEKFGRCKDCNEVITPGHIVILFATTLMWPKGTDGPDNIQHRCKNCTGDDRWETTFEAKYPGMWNAVGMTLTSGDGDVPEDL